MRPAGLEAFEARSGDQPGYSLKDRTATTLPPRAFASKTLSCIKNRHEWDLPAINGHLKANYNCVIDGGYGKIKGKTFRISNMGDETEAT